MASRRRRRAVRFPRQGPSRAATRQVPQSPQGPVAAALALHGLSRLHALALQRLPGQDKQLAAVEYLAKHRLNAAQTKAYISALLQKRPRRR